MNETNKPHAIESHDCKLPKAFTKVEQLRGANMNTKAIEIAKRMTTNGRKWAGDVGELVEAVLAEEQSDEYEYHTTPGEVIQPDWESYDEIENEWNRTSYPGDNTIPGSPLYRSKKKREWLPKVGEWVKCGGKVFRAGIINNRFVYHEDWAWPFSEVQKPTPEEIALAERREKLPPIPEGWEWVINRSEKPHPEAKWNNGKRWSERAMVGIAYNASYEYIKPIQPCRTEEVSRLLLSHKRRQG